MHLILNVPRAQQLIVTMLKVPGKEHEFRPLIRTQDNVPDGLQNIRESLEVQGFFKRAGDIILHFWRHGTLKQYSSNITKWIHFVVANKLIVFPPLCAKHWIF